MEKTFRNYVKNMLVNRLQDVDVSHVEDGYELAGILLEQYNFDGTITYNREESKQLIVRYFEEFGEIVEDLENETGEKFPYSPFLQTESFVCCCAIIIAENILSGFFEQGMTKTKILKNLT